MHCIFKFIVVFVICCSANSLLAQNRKPNPFHDGNESNSILDLRLEQDLPIPPIPPNLIYQNHSPYNLNKHLGPQPPCPDSIVVWLNTNSQTYHSENSKYFGNTKQGKFMCESDARAMGAHVAHVGKVRN